MSFVSYAQNFEDVILWRALRHVENGFYIDIGAQEAVADSVSYAFFERGWHGISVEPNEHYAAQLRRLRPTEIVIEAAIGTGDGPLEFFEIEGTGLSTGDPAIAREHRDRGFKLIERSVSRMPLAALLARTEGRDVHWLKIDVEGMERAVIESWPPSAVRPWIVVVESTQPMSQIGSHDEWQPLLEGMGYEFVYFDGLNRFFISVEHKELRARFGPGPNVFDDFVVGKSSIFARGIVNETLRLQAELREKERECEDLRMALEAMRREAASAAEVAATGDETRASMQRS